MKYVKDYDLPLNIVGYHNIEEALNGVDLIVHAIPMQVSFFFFFFLVSLSPS